MAILRIFSNVSTDRHYSDAEFAYYKTGDIDEAAALITADQAFTGIEKDFRNKICYLFGVLDGIDDVLGLEQAIAQYWSSELMVSALELRFNKQLLADIVKNNQYEYGK